MPDDVPDDILVNKNIMDKLSIIEFDALMCKVENQPLQLLCKKHGITIRAIRYALKRAQNKMVFFKDVA